MFGLEKYYQLIKWGGIAAIAVGIVVYIVTLRYEVKSTQEKLDISNAALIVERGNVQTLQSSLDKQNDAIVQMKQAGDKRVADAQVKLTAANTVAETYKQKAAKLLIATPQTGNACNDAAALIKGYINENH